MAKALSIDLRRRAVDAIEQGFSCRQAAERFGGHCHVPAGLPFRDFSRNHR